jgi:carboxymethylenebutenolidase
MKTFISNPEPNGPPGYPYADGCAGHYSVFGPGVLVQSDLERDRLCAIRTKMTIPPVMQDVADILAFRDTQPGPGAVGTHGYCMSGPYSLAAAR